MRYQEIVDMTVRTTNRVLVTMSDCWRKWPKPRDDASPMTHARFSCMVRSSHRGWDGRAHRFDLELDIAHSGRHRPRSSLLMVTTSTTEAPKSAAARMARLQPVLATGGFRE